MRKEKKKKKGLKENKTGRRKAIVEQEAKKERLFKVIKAQSVHIPFHTSPPQYCLQKTHKLLMHIFPSPQSPSPHPKKKKKERQFIYVFISNQ